jgi:hypothetical protein
MDRRRTTACLAAAVLLALMCVGAGIFVRVTWLAATGGMTAVLLTARAISGACDDVPEAGALGTAPPSLEAGRDGESRAAEAFPTSRRLGLP